jgi:hypothetical protein
VQVLLGSVGEKARRLFIFGRLPFLNARDSSYRRACIFSNLPYRFPLILQPNDLRIALCLGSLPSRRRQIRRPVALIAVWLSERSRFTF